MRAPSGSNASDMLGNILAENFKKAAGVARKVSAIKPSTNSLSLRAFGGYMKPPPPPLMPSNTGRAHQGNNTPPEDTAGIPYADNT